MKKIRLLCTLASFVMLFAVTLTGCGGSKVSYKEETKTALHGMLDSILMVAGDEFNEIDAESKSELYTIVEDSLAEAKISDKELNALIELPTELAKIEVNMEKPLEAVRAMMDTFYATKVTHTKIATFVYVVVVEAHEYACEKFGELYVTELELAGKVIDCVPKKDFLNVTVAMLDSAKNVIYSDYVEKAYEIFGSSIISSADDEGGTLVEPSMPTKAEVKTMLSQYIKTAEQLNKIWSEKNVKSVVTILKNFVIEFQPTEDVVPTLLVEMLDDVVTYVKVSQKVQIAVLKAIDDKMLDVLLAETLDQDKMVIALGKLVNAAITNTGLTKKLILDCKAFELEGAPMDVEVLEETLDIIFNGAPKFKNMSYDATLDQNDQFTMLLIAMLATL